MSHTQAPRLLVTGAAGQLGRLVVDELLAAGARVAAGTRDPAKLAELALRGVAVRAVDFSKPETLDAAFDGIERLLVISTDTLDAAGTRQRQHEAAVAAGVRAGVRHVVYTSMLRPEPPSPVPFAPDHFATEQALAASGLGHTVLRVSWYMENLLASLPHAVASGTWYSAAGDRRLSHVARADVARVAAAALTREAGSGIFDLTGSEALTTAQIAALVSDVAGRSLAVVPVTDEQHAAGLTQAGIPAPYVPLLVSFDVNTRDGRSDAVTDVVETFTGRSPQTLRAFLTERRATLLGG